MDGEVRDFVPDAPGRRVKVVDQPRRGAAFRHRAVRDDQSAAAEHEKRKDKCFQKEKAPLVIPAAA